MEDQNTLKELDECIEWTVNQIAIYEHRHREAMRGLEGQLKCLQEEKSKLLGLSTDNIKIALDENDVPVWVRKE